MKRIFFVLFIALFPLCTYAQKEANWWYFGYGNSLNFNQLQTINDSQGRLTEGIPTPGTGNISTLEGCFSLSDKDGNLMMYSDGMNIWNKNGDKMPNGTGLRGGASSTQSGIIVPFPGDANKYYAISVAQGRGTNGITYSVVDMTLDNNLGNVTATKNMALRGVATDENVAAVRKTGSDNYWIVHRDIPTSTTCTVYVWELSTSGFSAPMTYTYTIAGATGTSPYIGYLKFSADGTRFGSVVRGCSGFLSGEFNPATGEVANVKFRNNLALAVNPYSFEFSLSGDQLFITCEANNLYYISWDNLRNTTTTTQNSGIIMNNVQMHPDGRIYGTRTSSKDLYVIMEPEKGAASEIRTFTSFLLGTSASLGLPTFAATYMKVAGDKGFCMNALKSFTANISSVGTPTYTVWDFGDKRENSTVKDTDLTNWKQTQDYTYIRPGDYTITVSAYDAGDILLQSQTMDVKVNPCTLPVNPNIHVK